MSASYEALGNMSATEREEIVREFNKPWEKPVAFEQVGLVTFEGVVAKSLGLFTVGCVMDHAVQLIDEHGISRVVFADDENYMLESVEDYHQRMSA